MGTKIWHTLLVASKIIGGLTQTRTGTDKIHTILSRDCLPISA